MFVTLHSDMPVKGMGKTIVWVQHLPTAQD